MLASEFMRRVNSVKRGLFSSPASLQDAWEQVFDKVCQMEKRRKGGWRKKKKMSVVTKLRNILDDYEKDCNVGVSECMNEYMNECTCIDASECTDLSGLDDW
jgi:hypothetical protein